MADARRFPKHERFRRALGERYPTFSDALLAAANLFVDNGGDNLTFQVDIPSRPSVSITLEKL